MLELVGVKILNLSKVKVNNLHRGEETIIDRNQKILRLQKNHHLEHQGHRLEHKDPHPEHKNPHLERKNQRLERKHDPENPSKETHHGGSLNQTQDHGNNLINQLEENQRIHKLIKEGSNPQVEKLYRTQVCSKN
jgi:hypothetical protein